MVHPIPWTIGRYRQTGKQRILIGPAELRKEEREIKNTFIADPNRHDRFIFRAKTANGT